MILSDPHYETQSGPMYMFTPVGHDNPVIVMKGDYWLGGWGDQL
jgi:hypothetical protein